MLLELTMLRARKNDIQATARLFNDSFIAQSNVCFAKIWQHLVTFPSICQVHQRVLTRSKTITFHSLGKKYSLARASRRRGTV